MAGFRFRRLVDEFVAVLERSSATVIRAADRDVVRPARLRVSTGSGTTECILFLWTVTRGGGKSESRPKNERRIQATKISGIPLEPGVRTLFGGWSDEFGVYAFWDPRRHTSFSEHASNSLQVTSETLETAHSVGIATYLRPTTQGEEVVVAVSPDSLLWYVENGLPIHNAGQDAQGVVLLATATPADEREFIDEPVDIRQTSRRYDLVETMRAYRDARFRPEVLRAYSYQCAVCGCALKLVDAAHVIPVSHPKSTDDITNGLALCRLHHGAYDNALLGIRSDYGIIVNSKAERRLHELHLDMGMGRFRAELPKTIRVPSSLEVRPDPAKLKTGLLARMWPDDLVA